MWISSDQFAEIAQTNLRAAQTALARSSQGRSWHGYRLEVRTVFGRGGKSGKQYQVKVSSLPPLLQERLKSLQMTDEVVSKLRFGDEAQLERNWKFDLISRALEHPKQSAERKAEIDRQHGRTVHDWLGRPTTLSKTTLYQWIKNFETFGVHGLTNRIRKDKGQRKVFISRAWSEAVPFDDQTKRTIEFDIRQYVRGLIKGGSQFKQTRVLAATKLHDVTAAYGYRVNDPTQAKAVFTIPQAFVQAESQFKAVYQKKSDRKAFEDNKPRIRRTIDGLAPMDVVVADVHHTNIRLLRDDGSTATAKMISFFDVATERFFFDFVLFEGRGGIRNTDGIRTFVNMGQEQDWGMPRKLYFDNGSEYRFADHLEDALKLGVEFGDLSDLSGVHRAKPYNAAAKRIEGGFRELNQYIQRHIPGWIDDDRMKPKGRELGKAHAPYRGGLEAFSAEFRRLMLSYDNMPKSGALKGKSPNECFRDFVNAGWRATILDPHDLLTVFTKVEPRTVRRHGIEVDGRVWTCDGLAAFFGRKVLVHIPLFGFGFNLLKVCDPDGRDIGNAVPDKQYAYFDPRGAQESARRISIRNKALTVLAKQAPEIDVKAELMAFGERHLPVVPNEPAGIVSVNRSYGAGHIIMPEMTSAKTSEQLEQEIRDMDEARSMLARAGEAMMKGQN